ncbi:MAG: apolipoprotein N-acyltransferase [Campylobacterota bacterium]|nr:apolipoprotein N-acyltransferase [Campylobacterota bacterium]
MQATINRFYTLSQLSKDILLALTTALLFSLFLYLEYFGFTLNIVNTISGLLALSLLLHINRRTLFIAGFFIGLLWFYWIGYSFKYYNVAWMVPVVTIGFGFVYALFFGLVSLSKNLAVRALILFTLSFFEPVDFNWMQLELLFVNSHFGILKWQFASILAGLVLFFTCKSKWRYTALFLLFSALPFNSVEKIEPPLNIKLVSMELPQELKWKPHMRQKILNYNFDAIKSAIKKDYDIVVLSESAFPLFLNYEPALIETLKMYSKEIVIVTGALEQDDGHNYNVTYLFNNENMQVARKMVLVPFGEYIPLPKFMREYVNKTFFDGASDYISSDKPTDFVIKGISFRNAVCYEATCEELYEDDPKYLIAISNNAWFMPSIEPTLQKLLMQFYARKHNSIIFHAANMAGTGIVK